MTDHESCIALNSVPGIGYVTFTELVKYFGSPAKIAGHAKCVENLLLYYNAVIPTEDNYMSLTFGDTFFSTEDCRKIGFVRQHIETLFGEGKLNGRERAILIASLLYAMA